MRTQSPLIVFFWWHLQLRCSMPASHETASSPCPSPNSTFLPRQYQESRLEDNPACCSTFTNWKPAHSRNTGPTFQESLLSGSPVIFWSYRLLSPQDWLGANLELTLLLIPHRCAELNCLTLKASLLQPERSRRVCSSSCTLLRHSLAYIHLLRLFFISFTDFSDASKCLQGTYPALRSPPTLLGHCAAWPEGLRRACVPQHQRLRIISLCGELGMRVAFCCLTALLRAIRQRTSLHPCVIQMIRCCSRSSMDQ